MVRRMLLYVMYPLPEVMLYNTRTWRYESLILTTEYVQNTVSVSPKIGGKGDLYSDSLTKMQARRGPYQMKALPKCRPDVGPIKWQSYQNKGQAWTLSSNSLAKVLHKTAICSTYDSCQIHLKVFVSAIQTRAAFDLFRVS